MSSYSYRDDREDREFLVNIRPYLYVDLDDFMKVMESSQPDLAKHIISKEIRNREEFAEYIKRSRFSEYIDPQYQVISKLKFGLSPIRNSLNYLLGVGEAHIYLIWMQQVFNSVHSLEVGKKKFCIHIRSVESFQGLQEKIMIQSILRS